MGELVVGVHWDWNVLHSLWVLFLWRKDPGGAEQGQGAEFGEERIRRPCIVVFLVRRKVPGSVLTNN